MPNNLLMEFLEFLGIFVAFLLVLFIGYLIGKFVAWKRHREKIPELREDAIKQSRSVLAGQFCEQISPYLPDFPYKPTEARFIGKPVDFVVFEGMDEKKISNVIFIEVKSSKSNLNNSEKSLKEAIQNKKVSWVEYRVPDGLTKERSNLEKE